MRKFEWEESEEYTEHYDKSGNIKKRTTKKRLKKKYSVIERIQKIVESLKGQKVSRLEFENKLKEQEVPSMEQAINQLKQEALIIEPERGVIQVLN
jgi:thymidylate synthase